MKNILVFIFFVCVIWGCSDSLENRQKKLNKDEKTDQTPPVIGNTNTKDVNSSRKTSDLTETLETGPSVIDENGTRVHFFPFVPSNIDPSTFGDGVEMGNFIYHVGKAQFGKTIGVGNNKPNITADGIFIIVPIFIKNISRVSQKLHSKMFQLTDEKGYEYEYSEDGTITLDILSSNTALFSYQQFQPNIEKFVMLVFEVPTKAVYNIKLPVGAMTGLRKTVKLLE